MNWSNDLGCLAQVAFCVGVHLAADSWEFVGIVEPRLLRH